MSLNNEQINALLAPLHPGRVRQVQGNAHLEAWDVRRWLIRIFGWGGWSDDILSLECISERSAWDVQNPLKGRHTVIYRCTMRLTIKDPDGHVLTHFDDGAVGDAINQPSLGDAHDLAMKKALSQALKRCAVNAGDAFGLGLYQGGRTDAVVGRSLAHPDTDEHETREEVTAGEMEPPSPSAALPEAHSDQVSGSASSGPAASDEASASTPPSAPTTEDVVASLRDRAIAAVGMKKREGVQLMARLGAEAAKAKVMQSPTTRPDGTATTLNVLLDEAMRRLNSTSEAVAS